MKSARRLAIYCTWHVLALLGSTGLLVVGGCSTYGANVLNWWSGKAGTGTRSVNAGTAAGAAGGTGSAPAVPTSQGSAGGAAAAPLHLYIGCNDLTGTIQSYLLDPTTGAMKSTGTFLAGGGVSNAQFNAREDRLYVGHKVNGEGHITTFARNTTTGALSILGAPVPDPFVTPTVGAQGRGGAPAGSTGKAVTPSGAAASAPKYANPQTLTLDQTGRFLVVPNYDSNNVYVYRIGRDGSLGALVSAHSDGIFAHHAVFTNNSNFVLVPYLGSNLIQVYDFNRDTGAMAPSSTVNLPDAQMGPRHLALHPNGMWLYSINETAGGDATPVGAISSYSVDQSTGTVKHTGVFPVPLPPGYAGKKNGSEIEVAPTGKYLYVSMRLDNVATGSLAAYSIHPTTGALTFVQQQSSYGVRPRQFSLSRDGTLMVVGNQNSESVAAFRVDPDKGSLTFLSRRDVCGPPWFARMATPR